MKIRKQPQPDVRESQCTHTYSFRQRLIRGQPFLLRIEWIMSGAHNLGSGLRFTQVRTASREIIHVSWHSDGILAHSCKAAEQCNCLEHLDLSAQNVMNSESRIASQQWWIVGSSVCCLGRCIGQVKQIVIVKILIFIWWRHWVWIAEKLLWNANTYANK